MLPIPKREQLPGTTHLPTRLFQELIDVSVTIFIPTGACWELVVLRVTDYLSGGCRDVPDYVKVKVILIRERMAERFIDEQ